MTTLDRPLASGLPTAEPEELGLSAECLARIGPVMQGFVDAGEIPGCVTVVARHGRIAHLEARGRLHLDADAPLRADTIFRLASATKPIAAVALLLLYEEGRFLLDEPIARFLPAAAGMQVVDGETGQTAPLVRDISFRDCLTHTVGFARPRIRAGGDPLTPAAEEPVSATVARLLEQPLSFQPGARWEYGAGITVAGRLVEVISGRSFDEFLRDRIFAPLGMPDTSFYLPPGKVDRFPTAYAAQWQDGAWRLTVADRPQTSLKVHGPRVRFDGSGGLLGTAADYARFAQMLLNGGELDGVRLLAPKTVQLMTTNHTGDLPVYVYGPGYGFGLGVFVRTDLAGNPLPGSVGSYGWGGVWGASYQADPTEDMFTLFFTQANGYWQNWAGRLRPGRRWLRWIHQFEALANMAIVDGRR